MMSTAAWLVLAAGAATAQTPPPASAFGRLPALETAAMSPDGKTIAMVGGMPGKRLLTMAPLDATAVSRLDLADTRISDIEWVDGRFALLKIVVWETVGPREAYNFERNVVVGADARSAGQLFSTGDVANYAIAQPVIGITPGDKPFVSVLGFDWSARALSTRDSRISTGGEQPLLTVVWKLDIPSGRASITDRGTPETRLFDVDLTGQARVRQDSSGPSGGWILKARAKGQSAWKTVLSGETDEDFRSVLGYSDADDSLYLAARQPDGASAIVRQSLASGETTVVAPIPENRSPELVWDPYRKSPIVAVSQGERPEYTWLDPEMGAVFGVFERAFKGKRVSLESWSRDRMLFLARVDAPDSPPVWYLFDKARKELSPIGEAYPELAGVALGKTSWVTYKARDGLEIPAYLTLPPGAPATGGKLPLIVLPHGGPAARDSFGFDFLVQFLATRGYAVLQPQFRGSWGFGNAFEAAGRREWGGKIQTDLLDGVADLAGKGVIDPARVCIVGASFGGYAALAGVSLNPDAYKCAVSVAGVSDLPAFIGDARHTYGEESDTLAWWTANIGRSIADRTLLDSSSPARQAARITAPLLLIHGDRDTTVSPRQTEIMQQAMQAAGKPVEVVILKNDDHYLSYSSTRTQMLDAVGAFLAKHLPVTP